jgi:hypothetical protein
MAWENGRYIRKKWTGGTCVSEYVGGGAIAELIAQRDQAERIKRKAQRELHRRMVKADTELVKEIDAIIGLARNLVAMALIADGHRQHKRQWRKDSMATDEVKIKLNPNDEVGMAISELSDLIEKIDFGKPTKADREALARCLHAVPNFAAALGDMATHAITNMINKSTAQETVRQAAAQHLLNMRDQYGYDNASAIERSLIMHVVTCWFRLAYTEQQFSLCAMGQHETRQGLYWDKRLSSAQRRYLSAVESLERVRRLMRPESPTMAVLMQQNNVGVQNVAT